MTDVISRKRKDIENLMRTFWYLYADVPELPDIPTLLPTDDRDMLAAINEYRQQLAAALYCSAVKFEELNNQLKLLNYLAVMLELTIK